MHYWQISMAIIIVDLYLSHRWVNFLTLPCCNPCMQVTTDSHKNAVSLFFNPVRSKFSAGLSLPFFCTFYVICSKKQKTIYYIRSSKFSFLSVTSSRKSSCHTWKSGLFREENQSFQASEHDFLL